MSEARQSTLLSVGINPLGRHAGTVVLRRTLDAAATQHLVDVLNGDARGGSALIMCPTSCDPVTLRRLRMACAAAQHGRVTMTMTGLPPLGARVLMSQARELLDRAPAGWVHAALGALEERYTACAALSNIRGLGHPNPRFGQHVMSMMPGTGFIAATHPTPGVRRVRTDQPLELPAPPGPFGSVVAEAAGGVERLREAVLASLGGDPERVEADPSGADFWGTSRYTEVVRYPLLTTHRLTELQETIRARRCGWCDGWVGASPCAYCSMVLNNAGMAA